MMMTSIGQRIKSLRKEKNTHNNLLQKNLIFHKVLTL
jgi:hypothetical protein